MADSIAKFFDSDQRPPQSGWGVQIDAHRFEGHSEKAVFEAIKRWRQNNGTFVSDIDVAREMWTIYREREPKRALTAGRMPSLERMAINAGKSALKVARAIVNGEEVKAKPTLAQKRQSICDACTHHNPASNRCYVCGCYLSTKTSLATERCPIGKW